MLDVVDIPLDVRFHHEVLPPTLARDRQLIPRVQGPDMGPIPIATAQEVLLVDRFADPRHRAVPQLVFHGRDPERAALPAAVWHIPPLDEFGSGALPPQALNESVNVLLEMLLIRRILPDIAPALSEIGLMEPLGEVANPMRRWLVGLLRSSLHEG